MKAAWLTAVLLGLTACGGGGMERMHPRSERTSEEKVEQPVRLVLPHNEPVLPPHSGREQFMASCETCHSARYITMQPRFSRKVWVAEVKKMAAAYGAPVPASNVDAIADYIVWWQSEPGQRMEGAE